jgi:hypothetical protein
MVGRRKSIIDEDLIKDSFHLPKSIEGKKNADSLVD